MARKFLTNVDLNLSELQNAVIQNLASDPTTGNTDGRIYYNTVADELRVYANGAWSGVGSGDIVDIQGTTNEVTVSITDGVATISLPATINADTTGNAATATTASGVAADSVALGTDTTGNYVASISGDTEIVVTGGTGEGATPVLSLGATISSNTTGNAATATYATTAGGVDADSVALGTDTTGDYVATVTAGTGISISGAGTEGRAATISNSGVTGITGTADQVIASASTGSVTLSLPQSINTTSNPTFAGTTAGNIQVGITSDNELDTSAGNLTIDSAGGTTTVDDNLIVSGNLTVNGTTTTIDTQTLNVEDNIITVNYGQTGVPSLDAGVEVERGDEANTSVLWDESATSWTLTNNGTNYHNITRKYSANVGDTTNTSFTLTHNLGTADVVVNIYDNSTYETVEADVVRGNGAGSNTTSQVTVSFVTAPSSNAYRVVVVG